MFKNAAIATILGLSIMGGCAADTGSQSRDLATGDFITEQEGCYRVVGDYDGDVTPPPINISIGDIELDAPNTMVEAQSYDGSYAKLLGEFVAVQVNIDAGADIDSDDIDVLIRAEDMLAAVDAQANPERSYATEAQLAELISDVSDINQGMRIEVPCMDASNEGVFEVDAPLPDGDKRMHERILDASAEASAPSDDVDMQDRITDASAEASAPTSAVDMQDRIVGASDEAADSGNGFHRPNPRPRPPHRPYR